MRLRAFVRVCVFVHGCASVYVLLLRACVCVCVIAVVCALLSGALLGVLWERSV